MKICCVLLIHISVRENEWSLTLMFSAHTNTLMRQKKGGAKPRFVRDYLDREFLPRLIESICSSAKGVNFLKIQGKHL